MRDAHQDSAEGICGPVRFPFSLWQEGRCKRLLLSPRSPCPALSPTHCAFKPCLTAGCSLFGSLPCKPVACRPWAAGAGRGGQVGYSIPPVTLFQIGQNATSPVEVRLRAIQRSSIPPATTHRANKRSNMEELQGRRWSHKEVCLV